MTADELRQASGEMRRLAEAAAGDHWGWRHFGDDPENLCRVVYYPPRDSRESWSVIADDIYLPATAEHIARMSPAVALAVADLIDKHVDRMETTGFVGHSHDALVTVARAFLGTTP